MPLLSTKNLTKHFDGVAAVDRLSLDFEAGKVTGIIGPNGSGKSTLINLLTGVLPFDQGKIVVAGEVELDKLNSYEAEEYGITRTFQDVRLFEQMPVLDNILVVLTERQVWGALFEKHSKFHLAEAEKVLRKVGLWDSSTSSPGAKQNQLAANLSYGQRKLLEVARVLAMVKDVAPTSPRLRGAKQEAEIILFDEPFAGMFPEMIKVVAGVIRELRAGGKAVVLVEHNIELIRELCDHVFVLDAGKLLAEGEPEAVLKRREVVEAYLGE
jgi:ABC-type branched-subunit amino acid transport system ATPase component